MLTMKTDGSFQHEACLSDLLSSLSVYRRRLPRLLLEHDVRNSLHIDAVACLELKLDILLGVVVHNLGVVEDGSIGGREVDKLCAGSRLGCGNNRADGKFAASTGNRPGESLESGNRVGNRIPYAAAASIDCKGSST